MQKYEILEFNKVLSKLKTFVKTELGTNKIDNIKLSYEEEIINEMLNETYEAMTAIFRLGDIPIGELVDIFPLIKRCTIGSALSVSELLKVLEVITTVTKIKSYVSKAKNEKIDLPLFYNMTSTLDTTLPLKKELERCIEGDIISDFASDALFILRRRIKNQHGKIKEEINQLLHTNAKMLTEKIVTQRGGRYVLPVKLEYKNSFKGIMHDQSSSGNTIYIEPNTIVKLTNELNIIIAEEKREITKILTSLSALIAENYESLALNTTTITNLDVIFAKANYSKFLDGNLQKINRNGITKLYQARHPLIDKNEVVANDVILGEKDTTMIITGPNTGGKTVTLKMMGLLSLMTQVGMLIPAKENSEIAIFDKIFADIGDEQSIEQSLSTFSSHMKRIINIIDNLEYNSLVLLDEIGAGTEPKEGVALAYAILNYLKSKGTRVLVTSHYSELKTYAYDEDGVMNASVEFDRVTLKPTYKLLLGTSGSSNALYVSQRLGLKEEILEVAHKYNENFETNVSRSIKDLETQKMDLITAEKITVEKNDEIQTLINAYETKVRSLEKEKKEILKLAQIEAEAIIKEARESSEKVINNLKELSKKAEKNIVKQHEINEAVAALNKRNKSLSTKHEKPIKDVPLMKGDQVFIPSINSYGELIECDSKGYWTVAMGALKTKLKKNDINFVSRPKEVKKATHSAKVVGRDRFKAVLPTIDLHGLRYEEAMVKLDKYFDDVMLQGYDKVYVNHGIGTGALKKGVANYLKNASFVKSYYGASREEGGLGITIVHLK